MGKLFDKFSDFALDKTLKFDKNVQTKLRAGGNLVANSIPWLVGISFFFGGVYGLESYLAIDFAKNAVENLKKNKAISDAQQEFYKFFGNEIIEKGEYEKIQKKKLGKISDENSMLTVWKSVYDK